MFDMDSYAGNCDELAARLNQSQTVASWSLNAPALAGLTEADQLAKLTRSGCDPARADRILAALVRRAAGRHGHDAALLVLLHLLSDMVIALATDLTDLSHDVLPIVVNELACQIRSADVDQPVRGWAVTLKLATRRAVLAEFRPGLRRNHPDAGERAVDAEDIACWSRPRVGGAPSVNAPDGDEDLDVVDVLMWAVRDELLSGELDELIGHYRCYGSPGLQVPEVSDRVIRKIA